MRKRVKCLLLVVSLVFFGGNAHSEPSQKVITMLGLQLGMNAEEINAYFKKSVCVISFLPAVVKYEPRGPMPRGETRYCSFSFGGSELQIEFTPQMTAFNLRAETYLKDSKELKIFLEKNLVLPNGEPDIVSDFGHYAWGEGAIIDGNTISRSTEGEALFLIVSLVEDSVSNSLLCSMQVNKDSEKCKGSNVRILQRLVDVELESDSKTWGHDI